MIPLSFASPFSIPFKEICKRESNAEILTMAGLTAIITS
jgi:hypothetical protein